VSGVEGFLGVDSFGMPISIAPKKPSPCPIWDSRDPHPSFSNSATVTSPSFLPSSAQAEKLQAQRQLAAVQSQLDQHEAQGKAREQQAKVQALALQASIWEGGAQTGGQGKAREQQAMMQALAMQASTEREREGAIAQAAFFD
jgi:hypothetical protein